jgi:hypothetical protein
VLLDEGEMRNGEALVTKAREGRMADLILVLFSRRSLPSPWPRTKWEDALQKEPAEENVRIGFVTCDDCSPPRILVPRFDLAGLPLLWLRRLKRWVRTGAVMDPDVRRPEFAPQLEALGAAIADRPGTSTVEDPALALEFARVFRQDFDAVVRLECGGRSVTALAGDLAVQLGLRLDGDLPSNLARLRDHCSSRRFLLWLEGASTQEASQLAPGQGSSTLISTQLRREAPSEDESLRAIQYIFSHPEMARDWAEVCRLAHRALRLAAEQGRVAESFELLQQWHALAEARQDRKVLEESARAMVWILEGWDRLEEARSWEYRRASQYDDQMALPVSATAPPAPRLLVEDPGAVQEQPRAPRMPRPEQYSLF